MKKIMSGILAICTLVSFFSLGINTVAAEVDKRYELESAIVDKVAQLENKLSKDLIEIISERDRFTKVFSDGKGNKSAIISTVPIHYKDGEEWVDIDNTLVENASGDNYVNVANEFNVSIPKEISDNSNVVLEKDDDFLSFNLQGTNLFTDGQTVEADKKVNTEVEYADEKELDFLDKVETVQYADIGDDVSIEYSVIPNGIKENIVLSACPENEVQYRYSISSSNLSAVINDDKSVSFSDNSGNEIFIIPTPVMYDINGTKSYDIEVALTGDNGSYTLVYTPSYEWLSESAVYPVVVDPEVLLAEPNGGIYDATVTSVEANTNFGYEDILVVGNDSGNEYITYIGTSNLPVLNSNVAIKDVALCLYTSIVQLPSNSSGFEVVAYPVIDNFTEDGITYNNKATIDTSIFLDKYKYTSESGSQYHSYDVTEAYTANTAKCYGIALKSAYQNAQGLVAYGSSDYESSNGDFYQPYFYIEYYETKGVEEQFDYHTKDVGRAGVVYYNDFTNQVYIERSEMGLEGNLLPVQIKRYYNSGSGGTVSVVSYAFSNAVSYYGYGWLTNYNQFIEYAGIVNGRECIIYNNPNGKATYFMKTDKTNDGLRMWEEVPDDFSSGEGYELWLPTSCDNSVSNNLDKAYICGPDGLIYEFNSNGLLVRIKKSIDSNEQISVSYNSDYSINKIVDGAGREYRFYYTKYDAYSFSVLTKIQAFDVSGLPIKTTGNVDYKIQYQYNVLNHNGTNVPVLSSVIYPDGEQIYYTMTENLIRLINVDGYSMEFAFSGVGSCEISEKVYCSDGSVVEGEHLSASRVNVLEKTFTDSRGVTQTKQFDLFGRTICIINADGSYAPKRYTNDMTALGYIDYDLYIEYESYALEGTNLIPNGNFNSALSGWTISASSNVYRATNADCNKTASTIGSLCFKGQADGIHYASRDITISDGRAGDRYVFDFANKTYKCHCSVNNFRLCFITIRAYKINSNKDGWVDVCDIIPSQFNTNWQKYSCGFTIDFEYDKIQILFSHYNEYGHAWYDDLTLVNTYKSPLTSDTIPDSGGSDSSGAEDGCTCGDCIEIDCPCRTCSDTCSIPCCNRGYDYGESVSGTWFTVSDGQKQMTLSQTNNGNYVGTQTDMNGLTTQYNYNQSNGQLISKTDGKGNKVSYTYDAMNRLNSVSAIIDGVSADNHISTSYEYENDRISSVSHNGTTYNYEYDAWGNVVSIKQNDIPLINYTYGNGENRDRTNSIIYGNGDYTVYGYTADGYVESIESYTVDNELTSSYIYAYDSFGVITAIKNVIENTEVRYSGDNTSFVLLNGTGEADDIVLYSTAANDDGEKTETFGDETYTYVFSDTQTDVATGKTTQSSVVNVDSKNIEVSYTADYFGRIESKEFSDLFMVEDGLEYRFTSSVEYSYKDINSSQTTGLVETYRTQLYGNVSVAEGAENVELPEDSIVVLNDTEYIYAYDNNGNIVSVSVDNGLQTDLLCSYVYDGADQLVRENNFELGKTIVYTYDGDNIVSKSEYEVTQGALGTPTDTVIYSYDGSWTDKLAAYDGITISTDAIGNPLNYVATNVIGEAVMGTLEWNGRQLAAIESDGIRYEFSYNSDGLRTSVKEYDSDNQLQKINYYIWDLGKLVGYYVIGGDGEVDYTIKMLYNEQGDSEGYVFSDMESQETRTLYFQRNMLGDIIGVYDDTYGLLISYSYDAYGNVTTELHQTGVDALLHMVQAVLYTPITYRGYMYDPIWGMYYLQSRYYNPLYGRFINADATDILTQTAGTLHGGNLFAYCSNNPIMNVDFSGMNPLAFFGIVALVIALAIIFIYALIEISERKDYYDDAETLYDVLKQIEELKKIEKDYWFAFYYHCKNVVEYGTGVNTNPSFDLFEEFNYNISYEEYCGNMYECATSALISSNTLWSDLSFDEKEEFIREFMSYDWTFKGRIVLHFYLKFYTWAVDTMDVMIGVIKDFGTL